MSYFLLKIMMFVGRWIQKRTAIGRPWDVSCRDCNRSADANWGLFSSVVISACLWHISACFYRVLSAGRYWNAGCELRQDYKYTYTWLICW